MQRLLSAVAAATIVFSGSLPAAFRDQTPTASPAFEGLAGSAASPSDTVPARRGHRHMMGGPGRAVFPPAVAAADLPVPDAPGRGLVVDYCSQCHGIPGPNLHTAAEWDVTASRMFMRMDHMASRGGRGRGPGARMWQIRAPTSQERVVLLDYLKSAAELPANFSPAASPATRESVDRPEANQREAAATLFRSTCSRCHALPNPAQHTEQDWPAVVKRMRGNMRRFGTAGISDEQEREIVSYLKSERRGP